MNSSCLWCPEMLLNDFSAGRVTHISTKENSVYQCLYFSFIICQQSTFSCEDIFALSMRFDKLYFHYLAALDKKIYLQLLHIEVDKGLHYYPWGVGRNII